MSERNVEEVPIISVIIPVYNDPNGLKDTLKSLVNQDYPSESFEIIVADNGSKDNTLEIAEEFAQKNNAIIKVVVEDNIQSSYAARNRGIVASKGSIIAFIDSDMSVGVDWLTRIYDSMEKSKADYLACGVNIYFEEKSIFTLYDKMTGFPIENYTKKAHFAPTCCLVVRKNVFEYLGLFDSRLISSGDLEFGNRVYESKRNLYYDSSIIMKHPARSSLKQLVKKFFRIGRGMYQLFYFYPERYYHLNRTTFNPKYYLPGIPWKFDNSMKGNQVWNNATYKEKLGLYLINWINNATNNLGFIYQKRQIRKSECDI